MCQYCEFGKRGKFKGRTPDFLILQDRFAVKIEKDEPYVGDYGLTVSDNEDARCYRKKDIHYRAYGGRGITICKEWLDNPKSFYDLALANGWKEGLTIERIDVNGNYCPENCKWIPMSEQYKNKQTPYQIRRKQPLPSAPKEEK